VPDQPLWKRAASTAAHIGLAAERSRLRCSVWAGGGRARPSGAAGGPSSSPRRCGRPVPRRAGISQTRAGARVEMPRVGRARWRSRPRAWV
jgi:hypothetical protein